MHNFIVRVLGFLLLITALIGDVHAQNTSAGLTPVGSTQTLAVTTASASVTLNTSIGNTVLIQNTGTGTAYIKGGATAATTDFPIQPGMAVLMNYPPGQVISAITASGTANLLISKGAGNTAIAAGLATTGSPLPVAITQVGTAIAGNASGTTGAVVGTLTSAAASTAYICGFNVQATGTGLVGPIVVAGLIGSSQTYQGSAVAAGGTVAAQTFNPCIPASAVNTNITITTTADATATAVNVNSWGFRQ